MTPDPLDDLLDRSGPRTSVAPKLDIEAMIADARRELPPRRRVPRVVLGVGLAALLVAGAGVAAASSSWEWGSGTSDPARSYTYTSPTWGACELRFGDYVAANPLRQIELDQVVDDWFANTDIEREAAPLVEQNLKRLQQQQREDADVIITDPRLPDLNYWFASDQAVGELLDRELKQHGFDGSEGTGLESGASQVHCEDEQWG
jgi:hypothetical protein